MKVEAVALQLAAEPGEAEANLERFAEAAGALEGEPDLVVAPELYNTGYDLDVLTVRGEELAEPLDGPTVTVAGRVARDRGATVVMGMLEDGEHGALCDTAVVVDPTGEVVPYRKTHRSRVLRRVADRRPSRAGSRGGGSGGGGAASQPRPRPHRRGTRS